MAYKKEKVRTWQKLAILLFILYLCGLSYFLFFAPFLGRTGDETFHMSGLPLYGEYNVVPFKVIRLFVVHHDKVPFNMFFLNVFGNILCYMPFGFLIVAASGNKCRFWLCVTIAAAVSATLEFLQFFFAVGVGDIDDVILNTSGAALGFLVYYIFLRRFSKKEKNI